MRGRNKRTNTPVAQTAGGFSYSTIRTIEKTIITSTLFHGLRKVKTMRLRSVFVLLLVSGSLVGLCSCRQNPAGPSNGGSDTTINGTADTTLQGFSHAVISFSAQNLFTTAYEVQPNQAAYQDTMSVWLMTSGKPLCLTSNTLIENALWFTQGPYRPDSTVSHIDSFWIQFSPDGKSIHSFNVVSDSSWFLENDREAAMDVVLVGDSIPLVSRTPSNMVFSLSGNLLRDHFSNVEYSHYDPEGCSIDWTSTSYDSTLWKNSNIVPTLTITLTK